MEEFEGREVASSKSGNDPRRVEHSVGEGGVVGAIGGAVVGMLAGGPIGAVVGGIIGGAASATIIDTLIQKPGPTIGSEVSSDAESTGDQPPVCGRQTVPGLHSYDRD